MFYPVTMMRVCKLKITTDERRGANVLLSHNAIHLLHINNFVVSTGLMLLVYTIFYDVTA